MTDRRHDHDRREGGGHTPDRRGSAPKKTSPLAWVIRSVAGALVLIVVIIATVRQMRPVYATRGKLGEELRKHAPEVAGAMGAIDSTNLDRLMATEKFRDEKRNFYEDVMRLKQVDSARADSIATYAVREAYVRGISPAIIFGVMLTENSRFISNAKSNVGAVGLMQVYPKVWLNKEMSALFGRDLASDSTNVKYGVFILSHYFNPKTKSGAAKERDWQTALLRYNGCVRGTNTPRCHTYPNKVQNFVEKQATSICDGRSFYQCIAKPFIEGLFNGGRLAPDPKRAPAVAAAAPAAPDSSAPAPAPAVNQSAGNVALPPVKDSVKPAPSATKRPARSPAKKAPAKKTTRKRTTRR